MSLSQLLLKQNNAFGSISVAMASGDTSVTLLSGHTMPTIAGYFYATIWDVTHYQTPYLDTSVEIVLMSYSGTTNIYNMTRAQEGTSASTHPANSQVAMLFTAGTANNDLGIIGSHPIDESTLQPGYYIFYNGVTNTYQLQPGSSSSTQLPFGVIASRPVSPVVGQAYVATDTQALFFCYSLGTWSEYGGVPSGGIIMWSGTIASIPTGWYLCNGSNSTPDLRNRFIVGAVADSAGVASTTVTDPVTPTYTKSGNGQLPSTSVNVSATAHLTLGAGTVIATSTGGSTANTVSMSGSFGTGSLNVATYFALAYIMKA